MGEAERILQACYDYTSTVGFFVVFSEKLEEVGMQCEIEHDVESPAGESREPDFAIIEGDSISDILEHKASLSGPKGALEEFTSLHQKYTKLMHGGKECNPQVTVLYPISKQDIVDEIADELPDELTLCSFDQESKHTELRFKLKGPIQCGSLEALLQGDPIVFNPSTAFSKYKFIKASPLVTYTAVEVWTMFPIFRSIKDAGQPSFEVDRDVLIERARSFYPPWIRNNQQITTSRVDNALDFLNVIDFIDWKPGRRSIVVYSTKGSRSGEMSAYFAERLARLQKKQRKRGGKASYGKGQATIDRPWR